MTPPTSKSGSEPSGTREGPTSTDRHDTESARRPRLALTLGDPRGIGPEVCRAALRGPAPPDADIILVGPDGLIDLPGATLVGIGRWDEGAGDAAAGRLSVRAVEKAVELALSGRADAVVTGPISKPALSAAGYEWPGHTEMLRELAGVPATALCLTVETTPLGAPLRVVLVTGHTALRNVPHEYTIERLLGTARLAGHDLRRWWGIEQPRLAVCGLNPHASDRGLFGDEEEKVCMPAIARAREESIDITGPFPADTVFTRAMRGEADAVLAPYHDVGMTAIKTVGFGRGVNVTLGLPFPRTSPDHGTAFDIAGTGRADAGSMRAALELAAAFAGRALTSASSPRRFSTR